MYEHTHMSAVALEARSNSLGAQAIGVMSHLIRVLRTKFGTSGKAVGMPSHGVISPDRTIRFYLCIGSH